jgi:DnaJ-class molecular chaperone
MNDFYKILGVARDASPDEIKKAYRKLAHQYHPDKAGKENEAKFKEINEAYQVLSDPKKRQAYDQFGTTDFQAGRGGHGSYGGSYEDIFSQFGGSGGSFGGAFGSIFEDLFGATMAQVQVQVEIRLTQALLGDQISFHVQDEKIDLRIPPGTQDGDAFRFPGKGAHYRGGRGDLIVVVRIKYPHRLNNEQKRILEELQRAGL